MNRNALYIGLALLTSAWLGACSGDSRSRGHSSGTSGTSGSSGAGASGAGASGGSGATAGSGPIDPTGGSAGTIGGTRGGGTGGAGAGGTAGAAGSGNAAGEGGVGGDAGAGGASPDTVGPCDIYRDAGQPCVAAYSTVRRLSSTYTGPLYQIRSESSDQNTGTGGQTHDIGQTSAGLADAAQIDAICTETVCTVSLLYDQSGRGNHLPVAKAGIQAGGPFAAYDDFEANATKGPVTVAGHELYSLYLEPRQGYRLPRLGDGVPRRTESQGIYLLADGTRAGRACCWEFGNVAPNPRTFNVSNALFFGGDIGDGSGAGEGPWFMADFEGGIWAGGSVAGDPGWGDINGPNPPNPSNPSLAVKFALGFLKTTSTDWALRMADVNAASSVTTAYAGALPKRVDNPGGIALGINLANSNESWGTFYEGAVVAGFPSDDTELAVLANIRELGYGDVRASP
ncbi:MAG TPA: arabinofuranosidase catalytic domain-containing protein [Polyangiaceae bacterium]